MPAKGFGSMKSGTRFGCKLSPTPLWAHNRVPLFMEPIRRHVGSMKSGTQFAHKLSPTPLWERNRVPLFMEPTCLGKAAVP